MITYRSDVPLCLQVDGNAKRSLLQVLRPKQFSFLVIFDTWLVFCHHHHLLLPFFFLSFLFSFSLPHYSPFIPCYPKQRKSAFPSIIFKWASCFLYFCQSATKMFSFFSCFFLWLLWATDYSRDSCRKISQRFRVSNAHVINPCRVFQTDSSSKCCVLQPLPLSPHIQSPHPLPLDVTLSVMSCWKRK